MEGDRLLVVSIFSLLSLLAIAFLFWRYIWFFRNPKRILPEEEGIVSPADGCVVYVRSVPPGGPVISVKKGRTLTLKDIVKEELADEKLLIGIFMSPFDVHYNRSPLSGVVDFVRHYPAVSRNRHMGSMHWRSLLKWIPIYKNSLHILQNERTVTKIVGPYRKQLISCYITQIAGGSVRGIESRVSEGQVIRRGDIFGMIKIGSQVDVVVSKIPGMTVRVETGDKVKAGGTLLIV